jgi:hypothetical protein
VLLQVGLLLQALEQHVMLVMLQLQGWKMGQGEWLELHGRVGAVAAWQPAVEAAWAVAASAVAGCQHGSWEVQEATMGLLAGVEMWVTEKARLT